MWGEKKRKTEKRAREQARAHWVLPMVYMLEAFLKYLVVLGCLSDILVYN